MMARAGERPTLDLAAGRAALEATLPQVLRVLDVDSPEALGWRQHDRQTLLVPVGGTYMEKRDEYLLRLHFRTGREWPPSAQFVNPDTFDYSYPADKHHLPDLRSPEVHLHPNYGVSPDRHIQLICCSATYEFYDVLHSVEGHHLWREQDTFLVTLSAIERAMQTHYHGRHARHGG